MNEHQETAATAVAKVSPPVAVWGAQVMGMSVADWIQWLTLLYLFLMVTHKAWTMGKEFVQFWTKHREAK